VTLGLALRVGPWIAILILIGALALQTDRLRDAEYMRVVCNNLRVAEHEAYRASEREAAAKNREHVSKIETEQKAKTDAIQSRWDADRARLAELLRHQGTPTPQGASGNSGSPAVPPATGGPDGTGTVCLPEDDALSAAENELKLFYLQEWIREQLRVTR
jgi:hypothetical protein